MEKQLALGLPAQDMVLPALTFVLGMMTLGSGWTNILFGLAHPVVFAVFVFLVFVPSALREKADMISAKSDVQVDTPEVRVTEWRLAPGSATGHHVHGMDYVIVPVTAGEMTIVAPNGDRSKAQLGPGKAYFRKAGVEHDVLNESASEIIFLEVELKP